MTTVQGILASEIKVSDEKFDLKQSDNYHLSMQLSMDNFSFAVLDKKSNQYLVLEAHALKGYIDWEEVNSQISETVLEHEVLNYLRQASSVSLAVVYPKSTLVPAPFYSKEQEEQFLSTNHKAEDDDKIATDALNGFEAYNSYYLPAVIQETFQKLFPKVKIMHYATPFLEGLAAKYSNITQQKVCVQVQSGRLDVAVVKGKELIFFNSFRYETAEDFMYHLLFSCEQLKLSPEELDLILYGEIDRTSTLFNLIKKYVRQVSLAPRNEAYHYSYKMDHLPSYYYYNLFNQYACV